MGAFKFIGNNIGEFVDVDMPFEHTKEMKIAHILINMDIWDGLWEETRIYHKGVNFSQMLDYEGIMFHYRRYHQ